MLHYQMAESQAFPLARPLRWGVCDGPGRAPVYLFYDGCNKEPIKLIAVLYF